VEAEPGSVSAPALLCFVCLRAEGIFRNCWPLAFSARRRRVTHSPTTRSEPPKPSDLRRRQSSRRCCGSHRPIARPAALDMRRANIVASGIHRNVSLCNLTVSFAIDAVTIAEMRHRDQSAGRSSISTRPKPIPQHLASGPQARRRCCSPRRLLRQKESLFLTKTREIRLPCRHGSARAHRDCSGRPYLT
jgi:hypothetical protein